MPPGSTACSRGLDAAVSCGIAPLRVASKPVGIIVWGIFVSDARCRMRSLIAHIFLHEVFYAPSPRLRCR
jgi:hypothetical protein